MKNALPQRKDIPQALTWDMTLLYPTVEDYLADMQKAQQLANTLGDGSLLQPTNSEHIQHLLETYERYLVIMLQASVYVECGSSVDLSDAQLQMREQDFSNQSAKMNSQTVAVELALKQLDEQVVENAIQELPQYRAFLEHLLTSKPHTLSADVEKTLRSLSGTLDLPYTNYSQCKLADMDFLNFEANGESYPLSFSAFENEYESSTDTDFRRAAFKAFSSRLRQSQHTIASNYLAQVQKEKIMADLSGYDSVFDYLLHEQKVSRSMYDDHIDTIMVHLAEPMRRYAKLLQKVHGLDTMTFADLKTPLDSSFVSSISIEQAQEYSIQSLALLGDKYNDLVKRSFTERWYDFAQNQGKSTGGFCASPYRKNSYILMSWTNSLSDVFTLVHEIGHAGHFHYASQQSYVNYEASLHFIEAPSTCNELLLGHYLTQQSDDTAFTRNVVASLVSNTYYHNFVTHFIEAHFQREVYRAIDKGEALSTESLHALKKASLQEFWGDAVEIDDDAALTWMRQPHYYMGLYPYTYSAGLNIATQLFKKLKAGEDVIEKWLDVLRAGGSKNSVELAAMVGVDISTTKSLKDTISYIDELITQVEQLTDELNT